jgi:hypothetical protein
MTAPNTATGVHWLKFQIVMSRFHWYLEKSTCPICGVKILDFPSVSRISDITGKGKLLQTVTSLSFRKSTTILHFFLPYAPTFLGITEIGEFKGLVLGSIIP